MPFELNEELIPELRRKFVARWEENKEIYDEIDINRLKQNDWPVRRYLIYNYGDINASLEHLERGLQWRKQFGINHRTYADIPQEFVTTGAVFRGLEDNKGRVMIFIRVKVNRKIPELQEYFRQFVMGIIDRVDVDVGDKGYGFVFDISGVGYQNADLDFVQFLISTLRLAFPCGLKTIIVYNLPRLIRPLWAVVKIMLGHNSRMIKFANKDDITKYIPAENLPKYMGGLCHIDFTQVPDGCRPVSELAVKFGFSDSDVKKYLNIFQPHIKEAYQLVHCVN